MTTSRLDSNTMLHKRFSLFGLIASSEIHHHGSILQEIHCYTEAQQEHKCRLANIIWAFAVIYEAGAQDECDRLFIGWKRLEQV